MGSIGWQAKYSDLIEYGYLNSPVSDVGIMPIISQKHLVAITIGFDIWNKNSLDPTLKVDICHPPTLGHTITSPNNPILRPC